jgi:hypothetical protein
MVVENGNVFGKHFVARLIEVIGESSSCTARHEASESWAVLDGFFWANRSSPEGLLYQATCF